MKTALYRKYRPATFREVIGQDVIVTTLVNQIERKVISHAYLFTGSRGTGKTSMAKIFARAVNCLSPENGNPCGKCEACRALANPSNLDIVEMDAASNNGVDKIRELIEKVEYMPSVGKYKVYIIDEVHMLSIGAFNALLKTLEEPPLHVVFILCTTEVQKLPATILSRCMRFDFKLVPTETLFAFMKKIYALEGAKADDDALMHIARLGEGSVRDMLSIGDRCLSATDDLTYDRVLEITGTWRINDVADLTDSVVEGDVGGIISKIEKSAREGKSVERISKELSTFARDLIVLLSGGKLPNESNDTLKIMRGVASKTNVGFLIDLIRAIGSADAEMRYSSAPRIVLESVLLSLVVAPRIQPTVQPSALASSSDSRPLAQKVITTVSAQTQPSRAMEKPNDKMLRVLGYVRNKLRSSVYGVLKGEYVNCPDNRFALDGKNFVVYATEADYLTFASPENVQIVQGILDELGEEHTLKVVKVSTSVGVNEQIGSALGDSIRVTYVNDKGKRTV